MRGAGTKNNKHIFHERFDSHEIMVIDMFRALNKLMFIEISDYWS